MAERDRFAMHKEVDTYLRSVLPPRDELLAAMERYAVERGFPFIGPLVGPLLGLLARSIGAKRVFEMGSGFGFSAVHFARAIDDDGRVICIDGDRKNAERAREYFEAAAVSHKIDFRVGDAIALLKAESDLFDVILMDIDKEGYPDGFRAAWPKVRVGGYFIADNLLWSGRVMSDDKSPATTAIREFTSMLYQTPNALTTILPLRDGVSVSLKTA